MKSDTKQIGKRVSVTPQKEIADLRAELDDFVRRVPTLSQTELNQAKEKLIHKLASTTRGASSPFRADARKKSDLSKIPYGIGIALAAALLTILRPLAARDYRQARETRRCFRLKTEAECNSKAPCAWCPQYNPTDGGPPIPPHCCNTADIYDVCMRN